MSAIIELTRERGHPPSAWDSYDRGDQIWLLADMRARNKRAAREAEDLQRRMRTKGRRRG